MFSWWEVLPIMTALQIVFENQWGFMILNLTFLSFWLAPTIWGTEQRREMVTSGATSRLYIQCHQQGSADWEEKVIAAVPRSSFWDPANFSSVCLGFLTGPGRELMSSLVSLSGDLWRLCWNYRNLESLSWIFRNYTGVGQLGWELVRRTSTGCILFLRPV